MRFLNDLRFAARQLRKSPGFLAVAVVTLALGIGANTAIFSVVNALLLRPLPYPQPDRLGLLVRHQTGQGGTEDADNQDNKTFRAVKERVPAVMAAASSLESGVNLQSREGAQYVQALRVSSGYFRVLGFPMQMGRGFTPAEDMPGGAPVAVVSHALWRTTFRSDPAIIGRTVLLKGAAYTIVGVLPRGAQSPKMEWVSEPVDVWTPLQPSDAGEGGGTNYQVLLRLRPGKTWAEANAQLSAVRPAYFAAEEKSNPGTTIQLQSVPLQVGQVESTRPAILGLMLAVGFILLIACANLAGLALVRAQRRSGELATRLALGATRWQLARQLWTENLLLALIGGAAGLAVAQGALLAMERLIPEGLLPLTQFSLDGRVLLFTLAASLLSSLLFGMLPALELNRVDLRTAMTTSASRGASASGHRRTRTMLIAVEIALTVVLVSASGLLLRSLIYLETLPPGFDATNVMTAHASLDDARYQNAAAVQHLFTTSIAAMRRIPGVENAAVGLSLPYERGLNDFVHIADGKQAGQGHVASVIYVTPGYFDVLRMRLLAGRDFGASDTAQSQPVAIVNASYARRYLETTNPVGRHLGSAKEDMAAGTAIVGEVGDVVKTPGFSGDAPLATEPTIYVPTAQVPSSLLSMVHVWFQPSWIVRTRGPVAGIPQAMQQALAQADPNLPFAGFASMASLEQQALGMQRVESVLLAVLGGLALLLSAVGVYGLIANLVTQRRREIGIRLALGSTVQQAMLQIGRPAMVATASGLAAGIGASLLTLTTMKSLIFGVQATDPIALAGTAVLLGLVATAATLLPTRQIARIDPAETLREE